MADLHRYVTKTGNDGNDGSSWADEDAWLTIQHAADNANPAGGTPVYIHVAAGTYAEQVDIDTYAGTDDDNRIIYDGDVENTSGDGATRPIVDGESSRNFCFQPSKGWITIQDIEIKYAVVHNFMTIGGSDTRYFIIERCISHHAGMGGIVIIGNSSRTSKGQIVRNNMVYENNTGDSASNSGIVIVHWGQDVGVYNNTIFKNKKNGIRIYSNVTRESLGIIVKNNIVHDNTMYQIYVEDRDHTVTSDYNDLYKDSGTYCGHWKGTDCADLAAWKSASSQDANSQEGDPKYVNEGAKDFHITDSTSPCYQNGTDLSGTFTDDYDQDTRVHWDIGADYIVAVGYTIIIGSGAFAKTGQIAALLKGSKVIIGAGGYVQTGQVVSFLRTFNIVIGQGTFIWTGSVVAFIAGGYTIVAKPVTAYAEQSKPSTNYSEVAKPITPYEEQ